MIMCSNAPLGKGTWFELLCLIEEWWGSAVKVFF